MTPDVSGSRKLSSRKRRARSHRPRGNSMSTRTFRRTLIAFVPYSCVLIVALSLLLRAAPTNVYQVALQKRLALVDAEVSHRTFRANWNSLGRYQVPDWFRDAKFGIFIHWGVYSVPAFGNEWYSRNMYVQGTPAFEHQVETYGPQSKFGYKDFIPMFTASKFNADEWVDLFVRAGAKYVVPVAEHCDGFPMYASDFTAWNAARMGPKRDVVGEIAVATRKRNLHFGASSHRAEHWWWYDGGTTFDSDVNDPQYAGLYGPAQPRILPGGDATKEPDPNHLEKWLPPDQAFLDDWLARSTEIIRHLHRQTQGRLPVIGVGGIFTAADAWEKITAGASLVQVYSGLVYEGPGLTRTIVAGLADRFKAAGVCEWSQAVGSA